MAKKKQAGSFTAQAEEMIREEALNVARATQAPGQSKEQTKLIAKGIAKGIAQYKKQEKTKLRERAKLQKKRQSAHNTAVQQTSNPKKETEPSDLGVNKLPGLTAASIFLLVSLAHLVRLITGTPITIGTFSIPVFWSVTASVVALVLAIWIYRSTTGTKHHA